MSRFTSISSPSGFACEAVTPSINYATHSCDECEQAGDPATLIGLALAFVRQGPFVGGKVPALITDRLEIHAQYGNSACRLVLDWLAKREAVSSMPEHRHPVADPSGLQNFMVRLETISVSHRGSGSWPRLRRCHPLRLAKPARDRGDGGRYLRKLFPRGMVFLPTPPMFARRPQMDKLTRIILKRMHQEQRRSAKRIALTNGLLELKIRDWNGELVRRYAPAFDISSLTMNFTDDLVWFQKRFVPYLRPSDVSAPSDVDARAFARSALKRTCRDRDAKGSRSLRHQTWLPFPPQRNPAPAIEGQGRHRMHARIPARMSRLQDKRPGVPMRFGSSARRLHRRRWGIS